MLFRSNIIVIAKFFVTILTTICVFVDSDSFSCTPDIMFTCVFYVKKGLFYRTIPMFITLFVIVFVSLYVMRLVIKQQRAVAPVVINLANIPTVCERVEQDINVEDIEDVNEVELQEEVVIQRNESNPHVFNRVTRTRKKVGGEISLFKKKMSFNNKQFLEKTKVILKSNLLTLSLISTMIPQNLVVIYVCLTGASCWNEPKLIVYGKLCGYSALFTILFYPLLVKRKLDKISMFT